MISSREMRELIKQMEDALPRMQFCSEEDASLVPAAIDALQQVVVAREPRRLSPTTRAVADIILERKLWTTRQLHDRMSAAGVRSSRKGVLNSVGYLVKRGDLRRVGYGAFCVVTPL